MIGIRFEIRYFIFIFSFLEIAPRVLLQLIDRLQNSHIFPFTQYDARVAQRVLELIAVVFFNQTFASLCIVTFQTHVHSLNH